MTVQWILNYFFIQEGSMRAGSQQTCGKQKIFLEYEKTISYLFIK